MGMEGIYSIEEIKRRVESVAEKHRIREIYLFGSYARGEATPKSDVDFIIDMTNVHGLWELEKLKLELESALGREVDLVSLRKYEEHQADNTYRRFHQNVEREKVLIHGKDQ